MSSSPQTRSFGAPCARYGRKAAPTSALARSRCCVESLRTWALASKQRCFALRPRERPMATEPRGYWSLITGEWSCTTHKPQNDAPIFKVGPLTFLDMQLENPVLLAEMPQPSGPVGGRSPEQCSVSSTA
jgi:hypothetical protein